jgi:hypothetical protein
MVNSGSLHAALEQHDDVPPRLKQLMSLVGGLVQGLLSSATGSPYEPASAPEPSRRWRVVVRDESGRVLRSGDWRYDHKAARADLAAAEAEIATRNR